MTENIEGKVIVITGASSGLGAETARHLTKGGARAVLGARRLDQLEALANDLGLDKRAVVKTDVTDRNQVKVLVDRAVELHGRVDVILNNAGLMPSSMLDKLKIDEWDRMIDVNIKGVLYGVAAVLPQMRKQRAGHIINVASVAGLKVFSPIGTVYSATKFAVRAISEGLRTEVGADIRVTIISPGAVESELKNGTSDADAATLVGEFYRANQIPPDSVARAIAYAIEQPADVDINEIVLRPTVQEF